MYIIILAGSYEQFENYKKNFPKSLHPVYGDRPDKFLGEHPEKMVIIKTGTYTEKPWELLDEVYRLKYLGATIIEPTQNWWDFADLLYDRN